MAHVADFKKEKVTELVKLIKEYPIIGALNMENLPATALQTMRSKLRNQAVITMTKRRLMKLAFEEADKEKQGVKAIIEHLKGMPALLFTKENPFSIYATIKKSKSAAPAKPGQVAPRDIEIKAGQTPFMPGPIIGELGQIGIKTGVEGGKVAIKEDTIVVYEGEEIKPNVAGILARLDIKPMEIGLDITAIYEEGVIYDRKVLDIDEVKFLSDLTQAASWARNLAMEISYATKDIIGDLIGKAHTQAKSLGIEANILEPGIIGDLLAKAGAQAAALQNTNQ